MIAFSPVRWAALFLFTLIGSAGLFSCAKPRSVEMRTDASTLPDDGSERRTRGTTPTIAGADDRDSVIAHAVPLPPVNQVVAGNADTCALASDGNVFCWGYAVGSPPVRIPTPGKANRLGSIEPFCIELASTREWLCRRQGFWEGAWDHVIKDGSTIRSMWPASNATVLAVTTKDEVLSWQPPLQTDRAYANTPMRFRSGWESHSPISALSRNGYCVADGTGNVTCACAWQHGGIADRHRPFAQCGAASDTVPIPALHGATALVASVQDDVCARMPDGTTACVHDAADTSRGMYVNLQKLQLLGRIASFETSKRDDDRLFACALTERGDVHCWGANGGHVLGPQDSGSPIPVHIPLPKALSLTLGDDFGCALTENHEVYCWGENRRGQCGNTSHAPWIPSLRATFDDAGAFAGTDAASPK